MVYKKLMKLGLSEKEAKIYLASLKVGAASVQTIAREAGVNRATAYTNIDVLIREGVMSHYKDGKRSAFYAEPPEKAISLLIRKQQMELDKQKDSMYNALPELKARQAKSAGIPVVQYYKGKEGVKEGIRDGLRGRDDHYRIIYNHDEFYSKFRPSECLSLAQERLAKNIFAKIIRTSDIKTQRAENSEAITIPPRKLEILFDISLYDKTLRIISLEDPLSAITIENKHITNSFKQIFDLLWRVTKKRSDQNLDIVYVKD